MPKTTEQHLIVRNIKSEAAITNNKTALKVCTVEANQIDRKHRAASVLTAELLVNWKDSDIVI